MGCHESGAQARMSLKRHPLPPKRDKLKELKEQAIEAEAGRRVLAVYCDGEKYYGQLSADLVLGSVWGVKLAPPTDIVISLYHMVRGTSMTVSVQPDTTVAELLDKVAVSESLRRRSITLYVSDTCDPFADYEDYVDGAPKGQMQDESRTLASYGVTAGDTLGLWVEPRGGGCRAGFVDVEETEGLGNIPLDRSGKCPSWRSATYGLNLEGVCTNKECAACGHMVIHKCWMGTFDLQMDSYKVKCPVCNEWVEATTLGFIGCTLSFTGIKGGGRYPPSAVKVPPLSAPVDIYRRYDPQECGMCDYVSLKITAGRLDRSACLLCTERVGEGESAAARGSCSCIHHAKQVHHTCYNAVKLRSQTPKQDMGYTHYWYRKGPLTPEQWESVVKAVEEVIARDPTAFEHTVSADHICLSNETGEPFCLTRDPERPQIQDSSLTSLRFNPLCPDKGLFYFCKTSREPYDAAVVATLRAAFIAGGPDIITIQSDGDVFEDLCPREE
ncbi:hypothetical protein KIPB_003016 [Kipferlia bialata]|uniref:Ubiquitin-like domain-containing protein n=1 Tax=Kipferlia bialata TaxID=797122 RepID=A0A9K3CRL5_9EUKA|nr:hypothetical protein KIPB_003016 [Kipferlia bialata]|eukprot:g3016.t1